MKHASGVPVVDGDDDDDETGGRMLAMGPHLGQQKWTDFLASALRSSAE
jgi:hypothetical protein